MISVYEMYSPEELKNKSLSDLKRDYVKNVQTYLSTVPASVRKREEHEDNVQQSKLNHQMKEFDTDLKAQGATIKPGFTKPKQYSNDI